MIADCHKCGEERAELVIIGPPDNQRGVCRECIEAALKPKPAHAVAVEGFEDIETCEGYAESESTTDLAIPRLLGIVARELRLIREAMPVGVLMDISDRIRDVGSAVCSSALHMGG